MEGSCECIEETVANRQQVCQLGGWARVSQLFAVKKKRVLRNVTRGLGFVAWLMRPVAGSCEYSNEPSGSIKVGEFLD
jgi:hypothetical protein